MASTPEHLRAVIAEFNLHGDYISAKSYGYGHINDTYSAKFSQGGRPLRYIVQRLNRNVFPQPAALMENVSRVCAHLRGRIRESGTLDATRRALTLIPTRAGGDWFVDDAGDFWRCFILIEDVTAYEVVESPALARTAAKSFGTFTRHLEGLPGGRLHEVIPGFHDTRRRFETFEKTLAADPLNRAAGAREEIAFTRERAADCAVIVEALARGEIPERVTHNDTKLNNILVDDFTQEGLCVIDLDTVMPGSALYDFGDMVRSAAAAAKEDETDLSRVACSPQYFEALATGYLDALGGTLNAREKDLLAFSGKLLTFECGMRFLTDHLDGDHYFKISRPGHNLERARNQFAMVRSIESQLSAFEKFVRALG
ncbi:MAG: aminoglycoside phosphotransferase family protein [Puniceicoccales bacterium]|jgi:hypothetical protein|nr:aminoglycoside phosphotransferase family protein [Puniceicoccales bacterium]